MRILYLLLFLLVIAALPLSTAMAAMSWWPMAFPQDKFTQEFLTGQAIAIVEELKIPADASFHEKTDTVRQYVHDNSVHKIDDEFYSYWHNIPRLLNMLKAHKRAPTEHSKPHMECASRSAALYWLLKAMKIHARPVVVYKEKDTNVSHTFLEVFNPETREWEIQDPDYNSFWKVRASGKRSSLEDLLSTPVKKSHTLCKTPQTCGRGDKVDQLAPYFAAASIIDIKVGADTILYNPERFPADHPFLTNTPQLTYCALFPAGVCLKNKRAVTTIMPQ